MRRAIAAVALAVVAFVVYTSNGHFHVSGDSIPTALTAVTLLSDGGVRLDRFAEVWGAELPYFLARTPRGIVSLYPVATSILAAPAMMPAIRAPSEPASVWVAAAHRQEKYTAAFITAVSVIVFALLCWQLGFSHWLTAGLTIFYAFGSQAFSTSSQLLWQHGPGVLFILLAFLCFTRLKTRATRAGAVCFALAWAVAVAIRPMNILIVGPLVALALRRFPHKAFMLLPAGMIGSLVITYNLYYFGTLGGGYATQPFGLAQLGSGVAGLLLSPGRGLFLYFPVAVVALLLAIRHRVWADNDIARAVLVSFVAAVLFYGSYEYWHGGWSIGPRYMTEIQPLLLILLGLARPARAAGALCFGVLLPYCIFVQVVGAYATGPFRWNADRVPDGAAALWDFRDNPIAHAFR